MLRHGCSQFALTAAVLFRKAVLEEKPDHFAACVRTARFGVRPLGAAPRPGMARAVDQPFFELWHAVDIGMNGLRIAHARGRFFGRGFILGRRPRQIELLKNVVGVCRVDGAIPITVKHDCRDWLGGYLNGLMATAPLHDCESAHCIGGGTTG